MPDSVCSFVLKPAHCLSPAQTPDASSSSRLQAQATFKSMALRNYAMSLSHSQGQMLVPSPTGFTEGVQVQLLSTNAGQVGSVAASLGDRASPVTRSLDPERLVPADHALPRGNSGGLPPVRQVSQASEHRLAVRVAGV